MLRVLVVFVTAVLVSSPVVADQPGGEPARSQRAWLVAALERLRLTGEPRHNTQDGHGGPLFRAASTVNGGANISAVFPPYAREAGVHHVRFQAHIKYKRNRPGITRLSSAHTARRTAADTRTDP